MSGFVKAPPKPWFEALDSVGNTWLFFVGSSESIPQLGSNGGITLPDRNLVGVDESLSLIDKQLVALHEMMHVAVSGVGDPHTMAKLFDVDVDKAAELEETFISFMAPRLFAILHRNGFLKLPKVPR